MYQGHVTKMTAMLLNMVKSRDVIRSPDIRTFESRSEVRTQFQHPEVRKKILKLFKKLQFHLENILELSHNEVT